LIFRKPLKLDILLGFFPPVDTDTGLGAPETTRREVSGGGGRKRRIGENFGKTTKIAEFP
jgi:hypothetical protein